MKSTFERLDSEKKQQFIEAALEEFTKHSFQEASLNRLVKKLGIAKGSIYQYFEHKQALYFYLKDYAVLQKRHFMQEVMDTPQPDFWRWLTHLFQRGLAFDSRFPLLSEFLYRYSQERSIPEITEDLARYDREALHYFSSVIAQQQKNKVLNDQLDAHLMAHLIVQSSKTLLDVLTPSDSRAYTRPRPVIQASEDQQIQAVRQLIAILRSGMNA